MSSDLLRVGIVLLLVVICGLVFHISHQDQQLKSLSAVASGGDAHAVSGRDVDRNSNGEQSIRGGHVRGVPRRPGGSTAAEASLGRTLDDDATATTTNAQPAAATEEKHHQVQTEAAGGNEDYEQLLSSGRQELGLFNDSQGEYKNKDVQRDIVRLMRERKAYGEVITPRIPETVNNVIIEIGTHAKPEFAKIARKNVGFFLLGVEPVMHEIAQKNCKTHRCHILEGVIGTHDKLAFFNVGKGVMCSSMLPLTGKGPCLVGVGRKVVSMLTLNTLLKLVPPKLNITMLAIDAQGFDLQVAKSLTDSVQRKRVANFLLECQDLPKTDEDFLYPGGNNCGEVASCMSKHWGLKLGHCWRNAAVREYNCAFYDPSNPDAEPDRAWITYSKSQKKKGVHKMSINALQHPAECPPDFVAAMGLQEQSPSTES